ncbi:efflux RND transporter periplasmic adaptor subunit [Halobacillus amylolyticus]|uniref:Efflux RND transporter periplasmic adaptor subunit n=1 Tax=Halobacillus amylolyticus TaxID=2932259 RepID=A0ABY4HCZ7_9BACI|nr:efflux RND transporter periplasmic adaptor subunit [Halobacillus amylolyticus]UOR11285.1 efflux RND transporter periplasmic adaptor subunit [Halobacillus amylolyticus]
MKHLTYIVLLLTITTLTACNNHADEQQAETRTTPVETAAIIQDNFIIERKIVGRATTADTSPVISSVPGELVTLNVAKGDRIEEGETVGVVDPGDSSSQVELQQLAVKQAKTQLENAQVAFEQAQAGVENAKKQVDIARQAADAKASQGNKAATAAKQQYEQAQALADETKQLVEEGTVPEVLYQQAQTRADQAYAQFQQLTGEKGAPTNSAVAQAKAQVDQAEQQLEQARIGIDQAELQVEQAQVQLNQAEEQGANEAITAPASGEVSTLNASEGDIVTNQQPFATIVSLNPMTITAAVTAEQLGLFSEGSELQVQIDTLEEPVTSTVSYIPSVPDETGLYPVEATVDNADETIKPGMMATFLLPETVVEDTMIVPTDAVAEEGGEAYIYQVVDQRAVRVDVEVIESQTDQTAISGDVKTDAPVITSGQLTLSDGAKVSIMKEDA